MSFGLALAGGGIRGAAHVGVLAALEEYGLKPDSIAGTSAGGLVAGLYAAGLSVKRLQDIILQLSKTGAELADPDFIGLLSLIPRTLAGKDSTCTGLLKGVQMEKYMRGLIGGKTMRELPMRTVIPSVDLYTGQTVACTNTLSGVKWLPGVQWNDSLELCDAMRATSALPPFFRPKLTDRMCLVDGGIADVLPVDLLIAAGTSNVLAVDVSEDYKMPERINLLEVASHSLAIMETRLRECVTRGEKMLLFPVLPKVSGVLNLRQMPECMEAGYRSAKRAMPRIRQIFT
jgi:NTE family protein